MVIMKVYVMLQANMNEVEVRGNIADAFATKYPLISTYDFEFLKRDRMKLSIPSTSSSFEWNFESLKRIWGQGKLYCRLSRYLQLIL